MEKGLGLKDKKVWFEGKQQFISLIDFTKRKELQAVEKVLLRFLDASETFQVHTSGSTGTPKTLELQKKHMLASAAKTIELFELQARDKILLALSPNHIGGIMMLVRWLVGNLDLYITAPSKDPLKNINLNLNFTALVPLQLAHSLADLHKVKTAIIGGGAVSNTLEAEASKTDCALYHTYGMTETISHIALRKFGEEAVFKAVEAVEFEVDARNCLVINAPHLAIKNLQTNDVVELIDKTHFKWKGRYDNVINSGGIKLHPELIEKKLEGFPYPFFLAGVPDKTFGEVIIMVVGKDNLDKAELLKWVTNRVDKYEKPKKMLKVKALKFTENEKLIRNLAVYELKK